MNTLEPPIWLPPPPAEPARRSHRGALVAVLGAGAAAGVAAAIALTAGSGRSGDVTGSPDAGFAASQSGSGTGSYGLRMPRLTGTVTAVDTGSSTVSIKTSSGTATYGVDARSDIDKNGEASLGALKVGDAVTFSTVTTNGKATIAILHSGDEAKNRPAGGFGFGRARLDKSGTVTAVDPGNSTVTIKTSSGTATYAVDGRSDIDKNGEASLGALKVGDAVTFSTVTTNGRATIAILHSGDETKNRPSGGFGAAHDGGWGAPGVPGGEQGETPNG